MSENPAGWYPDPANPLQERLWDGSDWVDRVRPRATEADGLQVVLRGEITGPPSSAQVRELASDSDELVRRALSDESRMVRHDATRRIIDQSQLAQVYLYSGDVLLRDAIADRLTDPRAISDIVLKSPPICTAWTLRRLIPLISDPDILKQLVIREDVQAMMVRGDLPLDTIALVVDQDSLARLVATSIYDEIRAAALAQLQDQDLLVRILSESTAERSWDYSFLLHTVLQKLTEPHHLADVIINARPWEIENAEERYGNHALVRSTTSTQRAAAVRHQLLGRLSGHQESLARIATEAVCSRLRYAATDLLTDQPTLLRIQAHDDDRSVRLAACGRLTDQEALLAIARSDQDPRMREEAVARLLDQELLASIARTDTEGSVRYVALKQLNDQEIIRHHALNDSDPSVRVVCVSKLTDVPALRRIAATYDGYAYIHNRALERLEELGFPMEAETQRPFNKFTHYVDAGGEMRAALDLTQEGLYVRTSTTKHMSTHSRVDSPQKRTRPWLPAAVIVALAVFAGMCSGSYEDSPGYDDGCRHYIRGDYDC